MHAYSEPIKYLILGKLWIGWQLSSAWTHALPSQELNYNYEAYKMRLLNSSTLKFKSFEDDQSIQKTYTVTYLGTRWGFVRRRSGWAAFGKWGTAWRMEDLEVRGAGERGIWIFPGRYVLVNRSRVVWVWLTEGRLYPEIEQCRVVRGYKLYVQVRCVLSVVIISSKSLLGGTKMRRFVAVSIRGNVVCILGKHVSQFSRSMAGHEL